MKRTLSFMVMALALLLTQCRKPEVKFPSPVAPEGTTVSMTVTAGPGSKTDISETGAITWSEDDKLYVGYNDAYVGYLTLTSGQNTPTGWFSGNVTLPTSTTGNQTFHFFYLGSNPPAVSNGAPSATVSFASQTGLRGGLGSCHIGYGTAQGTVAGSEVTGINVMMKSEVALSRFSFKKSGTSEGYSGVLTLSGDRIYNSMTVGFGGTFSGTKTGEGKINLTNTTSSEKYVMLVPAGAGSATLNFGGEYEGATTLAQGIEANKYYGQGGSIEVVLTKAPVPVTDVTVDPAVLNLVVGGTSTLTATVLPAEATNKNVTWSSTDESVATVADGTVTAVAAGPATITVTTDDGNKTATCTVTVTAPAPTHETVNFGNPNLNWSVCNLGATNGATPQSWYGDYYAWGEVVPYYTSLTWTSATTCTVNGWNTEATLGGGGTVNASKGYAWESYSNGSSYFVEWNESPCTGSVPFDDGGKLKPARDAATQAWGEGWRMPTVAEWQSLYDNNTFEWLAAGATSAKVPSFTAVAAGYLVVKGGKNSSGIDPSVYMFLPYAGILQGAGLEWAMFGCRYWSSSLIEEETDRAYYMFLNEAMVFSYGDGHRYQGYPVRPVR